MNDRQKRDLDIALIFMDSLLADVDKTLKLTEINRIMFNLGKIDSALMAVKNNLQRIKEIENERGSE